MIQYGRVATHEVPERFKYFQHGRGDGWGGSRHGGPLGRAGGVAHVTVCFTVGVKRMHPYIASQYMYIYIYILGKIPGEAGAAVQAGERGAQANINIYRYRTSYVI